MAKLAKSLHNEPRRDELEEARAASVDLMEILSYGRKHGSQTELDFMRLFLLPKLRDMGNHEIDDFGNVWLSVPGPSDGPLVLWSCHVDTVHAKGGRQQVQFAPDGRTIQLAKQKPGRCLGADNGAGVWLLLEMLRAGVPGGYVFHRGEEVGRLGSSHVEQFEPERLLGFDACVAFDRKGTDNLITHQMGMRCASETFSDSFGGAINLAGHGLAYRSDDTGSYTDSYTYAGLIAECANVSVGYDREHGPKETLDLLHLWRLREAILRADFSGVECPRDCTVQEYDWGDYGDWRSAYARDNDLDAHSSIYGHNYGTVTNMRTYKEGTKDHERRTLTNLIERFPGAAADLLQQYGLGADELLECMTDNECNQATAMGGWSHD